MKQTCNLWVWILAGTCLLSSCEERLSEENALQAGGKTTDVSLCIGYEPLQDAYDLLPETRSSQPENTGFSAELEPSSVATRSTQIVPDKLYNMEIGLYDDTGVLKHYQDLSSAAAGSPFTLSGIPVGTYQLVLLARGSSTTPLAASIAGMSLADVRNIGIALSGIDTLKAEVQEDMNKMPYMLYLEKVDIADNKITNPDGTDVRLLLKRLAARVTLKWSFSVPDYSLKEVSLQQVPKLYYPFPATTDIVGGVPTYPSTLKEYTEAYRLTDTGTLSANTYTAWVPANVRGIVASASSAMLRHKEFAPEGAMYADFRLENATVLNRRNCRIYIGGNGSDDFNVRENTDYTWNITLKNFNPNDKRVTEQSLSKAISGNLVPTANCLMLEPGNNICFNPYKHSAGTNGWNTHLTDDNGTIITEITKVKVYWQTRDAGTVGDFVLGCAISDDDHTNMVNFQKGTDTESARVHVKAPSSQGGNALIAAYKSDGEVAWSWHIWVTDYIPKGLDTTTSDTHDAAIKNAKTATQNGKVQTYGGVSWTASTGAFYNCVIMDRNLGATRAGLQTGLIDAVRTFGLLYQGMRKDPFFSTADGTASEVNTIYDGMGKATEGGAIKNGSYTASIGETIINPLTYYYRLGSSYKATWGGDDAKTLYDPCPDGWRVPSCPNITDIKNTTDITKITDGYISLTAGFGSEDSTQTYGGDNFHDPYHKNVMYYNGESLIELRFTNKEKIASAIVGSGFIYSGGVQDADLHSEKSVYFPAVSLREAGSGDYRERVTNNGVYLWSSNVSSNGTSANHYQMQRDPEGYDIKNLGLISNRSNSFSYGFSVRCVQDNIQKGKKPEP